MLTEREVRLITLYADMIGDQATGLAAQQAVSDDGPDADRSYPAIHTVLRERRKAIAKPHGQGDEVSSSRASVAASVTGWAV